jgi:hypothetical protein
VGPNEGEARSTLTSTVGGVMTEEVGAVTGELEVVTRPVSAGVFDVVVRYAGADEWYRVAGGPIRSDDVRGGSSPSDPWGLHGRVLERLATPGRVVRGNEEPTNVYGLSP